MSAQPLGRAGMDIEVHYRVGRAWLLKWAHRMDESEWLPELENFCWRATGDKKIASTLCTAIITGIEPEPKRGEVP